MRVMMEKREKDRWEAMEDKALFSNMDSKGRMPELAADFCYC